MKDRRVDMKDRLPELEVSIKRAVGDHAMTDPQLLSVYDASYDDQIVLVEVTACCESSNRPPEVLPFKFAPTEDVPFNVTLVLLSPNEWEEIKLTGKPSFPSHWSELVLVYSADKEIEDVAH